MVSTSIERSFLPSFITEPLPNWRSIWDSAADRALVLSMEDPATIRRAATDIAGAPYGGDSLAGQRGRRDFQGNFFRQTRRETSGKPASRWLMEQRTLFVLSSQYVLFGGWADLSPC